MLIAEFAGHFEVTCIEEFDKILEMRHEGNVNRFWLTQRDEQFPALEVFVKNDLACLCYYREDADLGFHTLGDLAERLPGNATAFSTSRIHEDDVDMPNDAIVLWSDALMAAREYFLSGGLPKCVAWAAW